MLIKRTKLNVCLLSQLCYGRKEKTSHTDGLSMKLETCNAIQLILLKSNNFPFMVKMCLENDIATTQSLNNILYE